MTPDPGGSVVTQLGEDMFDGLLHGSHQCHPEDLVDLVATHAAPAGLHDPVLYLADLQQDTLVRVPRGRVRDKIEPVERQPPLRRDGLGGGTG